MGLILDILNITPRVRKRVLAGEDIREVFLEELNKEITKKETIKNKKGVKRYEESKEFNQEAKDTFSKERI